MAQTVIVPPGKGEVLSLVGETMRILADSSQTDGKSVVIEETTPPGGGPALHRHNREDEIFFVVEGTLKFVVDGKQSVVGAGGFVFAPRNSVHAFVNIGTTPSRMLIACWPGGLEQPFREADRLTREGALTHEALDAVFAKVGVEFLGPPLKP